MFDLKQLLGSWYYSRGDGRFQTPDPYRQVKNPLDESSEILQDMISRNVRPFVVQTINLSTASDPAGYKITVPGFHFVIYGHDGSSIKAVNTQAYVEVFWQKYSEGETGFPMKHARGFTGPFSELVLKWPAQNNVYADLVVHTSPYQPWIDGESCT